MDYLPSKVFAATCLIAVLSIQTIANAALVSRLGGLAYYDDVADLTWLADANAAVGSVYDSYIPGSGRITWDDANTWAAGLNINGVTGWRMPDTVQPDSTCSDQDSYGQDYNFNCTGSEMGNLFYNVLGGVPDSSITTTHNTNYNLFSNVQSLYYWSATEYTPNTLYAWTFYFNLGWQYYNNKPDRLYAWAVRSGDVSAVPLPVAFWLFGSGLIGLIGFIRKK